MFDHDTLIISYDAERGEPRGSRSKKADPKQLGLGSCVDCTLCVQVCPTGIDIRQGLQYECIGCAACIDVCDGIMDRMSYPRGLIRYATQNSLKEHLRWRDILRRVTRPRVLVYTAILLVICSAFVASLALRKPFRVDLVDEGRIENVYRLQIMNATEQPQHYRVTVAGLPGIAVASASDLSAQAAEARWVTLQVQVPPESALQAGEGAHPIQFNVERLAGDGPAVQLSEKSTFIVPR
jgi:cytochrome c oxidase accessory protein FixG